MHQAPASLPCHLCLIPPERLPVALSLILLLCPEFLRAAVWTGGCPTTAVETLNELLNEAVYVVP